jgi:hypothetical protein
VSSTIAKATLEAIDARIAQRGLLQHPFYQSWTKGELTLPVLRDYAEQYYQHVAAFPTYLSALHSHTSGASGWAGLNEGETRPEGGWDKLRENTTAAKAHISLVRMPQHQLGSGKAIEHW